MRFTKHLPGINCNLDPVINFKLKQKISHFGACITLGERGTALSNDPSARWKYIEVAYNALCTLTLTRKLR
jgi:hypothetical protein